MADWLNNAMDKMDPRPMGKGPGGGPWNAEQEQQYQTTMAFDPAIRNWRNKFETQYGEPPQRVDPQFDYREAVSAGNKPTAIPSDVVPHWDSRGKAPDHPTEWMNDFLGQFGADPTALAPGQWTPEMQDFMSKQLKSEMLDRIVTGRS
jgi:hypothetical protein